MARGDQLYRQWSILMELSRGRRSRRALAEQFGVSLKTITRDIDALSRFPIVEEREGIDVVYHCLPSSHLPHIALNNEEAAAVVLGKESAIEALQGAPFQAHFQSALAKIERLQQDSAYRRVSALPRLYQTDFATPNIRVDSQGVLLEAAMSFSRVWMRYYTATRQAVSERIVEPFFLHQHPYGLHLIAYCLKRGAFLNFNVNLIQELRVLDETFSPEDRVFDREAFLEGGFDGHYSLPVMDVRLRIRAPTSHWVRDRFFHPTQAIVECEGGAVEVSFRAGGVEAIVARVLGLGPDCEVLAPEALRQKVLVCAQEVVTRYAATAENKECAFSSQPGPDLSRG